MSNKTVAEALATIGQNFIPERFLDVTYRRADPPRYVQVIVIHTSDCVPTSLASTCGHSTAEYFQGGSEGRAASAHYSIGPDGIFQCLQTSDVAFGAKGANRFGVHIELAGNAEETAEDWANKAWYKLQLQYAAALVGNVLCPKFGIPVRWLTSEDLKAATDDGTIKGITGHLECTHAFGGTHLDPGWSQDTIDQFMAYIRAIQAGNA